MKKAIHIEKTNILDECEISMGNVRFRVSKNNALKLANKTFELFLEDAITNNKEYTSMTTDTLLKLKKHL